jgi:ABC-type proline/glycine betaine transport system permease subunit
MTMDFARPFRSDPLRHEGVRPFHVWGLRLFYALMLVGVAPTAWGVLLSHEGAWASPVAAVAWSVWATYPTLAVFGLWQPLRWLPLMFFTVGYKAIWMAFVAWPLWRAGTLAGTPAGEIAASFLALPLLALVIPWGYAWRTYVIGARPALVLAPPAREAVP